MKKELFANLAWTAHGTKLWNGDGNLSYRLRGGDPVPAMPELEYIFSDSALLELARELSMISIDQYSSSVSLVRDVRRVPLKISNPNEIESLHQSQSYDGLSVFYPFDIYSCNISSRDGLIDALAKVQEIEGFGLVDSKLPTKYSILLVDVAIFWQLFRMFYTLSGLCVIRHDLFLVLGLWHTYQHCHKLLWSEFRSTFLADAFFELFPNDYLFFSPKLLQSSTFFSYLRLSYKLWRHHLLDTISKVKELMLREQLDCLSSLKSIKSGKLNFM